MTSDQRTSRSGGGYIEQRHLPQEGMVAMPTWAWSPARSAEYHIGITGPTAGTADSASMTTSCAAFGAMARLLCYTSSPEAILCKELPYLNTSMNIGPRRGMCTKEDLLRLTLQEGCWYNLRSRKVLEDSKGHTTKSPPRH